MQPLSQSHVSTSEHLRILSLLSCSVSHLFVIGKHNLKFYISSFTNNISYKSQCLDAFLTHLGAKTSHGQLHNFTHSLIPQSVLRQAHGLFQSEFCYPVLPLSIFSIRSFRSCLLLLPRLPVIYIPPSIFRSITCFRSHFLSKM